MRSIARFPMFVLGLLIVAGCSGASSIYSPPPKVEETARADLSHMPPNEEWTGLFLLEEWREGQPQRVVLYWHDGNMHQMEEQSAVLPCVDGVATIPDAANFFYVEIRTSGNKTPEVIGRVPDSRCYFKAMIAGGPNGSGMMPCLNDICGYFYKAYFDGEVQILPESRETCREFFEQIGE